MAEVDTVATPETAPATDAPATETVETTPPAETTPAPATEPAPQLFAGKFKNAEEAYWHSQGQLTALQNQPKPTTAAATSTPKYTTDQLWTLRAQKLNEMTAAQIAGNQEQASTLAANINWVDNEIQQQNMGKLRSEITGQAAVQSLNTESAELLKPYQADLVPGNPLYEQAQSYFGMMKQAVEAGVPLDNVLSGLAVLAAAAKTGKHVAGTAQEARAEFAGSLGKALKNAVITGAGKTSKIPDAAPDFKNMSDAQFVKWKKENI